MTKVLNDRRIYTKERFDTLVKNLTQAEALCLGKACVYATGSFARGEAHKWSDLDLFIVGQGSKEKRDLSRLNEIRIKADLIEVTERQGIPEFTGDGRYLEHYTSFSLTDTLGKPEDDATNTFTARLLLLLESKPLLGVEVYERVIDDVISQYWQDFIDHKNDFTPAFLANDILRLWRTFCVNYEARTAKTPEREKAKRKLKNYKLKYSRLLTCYSAILYLLARHKHAGTVSTDDAAEMVRLTPTERLELLVAQASLKEAHRGVEELLSSYEIFLTNTALPENDLIDKFMDKTTSKRYFAEAAGFGEQMFNVLYAIGQDQPLYRMLVV
jgi:predicted nucleotidyltransferase